MIHCIHFCFHWPSGFLLTKWKTNYQTSPNNAGILMTELLLEPRSHFKALEILSESGEKFSFELRKDKCELWSIKFTMKVDKLIWRNCIGGIIILGAAIGSDAFVSSCLLKRVKKLEELLDNLAFVDDPQCALGILRFCLGVPNWTTVCNVILLRTNETKPFDNLIRFSVQPVKIFLEFC